MICNATFVTLSLAIDAKLLGDLQCGIYRIAARHRYGALGRLTTPWPLHRIHHCYRAHGHSTMSWPTRHYSPSLQNSRTLCNMVAIASNVHPPNIHSSNVCLAPFVHKHPSIDVPPSPFIFVDTPYSSNCMSCQNIVASILYCYKIWGRGTTSSLDDESITVQPEPRYQLRSNTQSFKLISLNSWSSQRYHQTFTTPLSSNTTPTKNLSSGYIISMVHQNSFGGLISGYTYCCTYFHTITVYSVASHYLYTHIHHGGQQFL